ncbi:hypothetical protein GYMLUDRAFT_733748 [Collybiopsis luxurians FD-317 M1]|nr:hypothetical protein GYMLUDRAFT_733748 [Collybiopsis luxurians FD-317 M1]
MAPGYASEIPPKPIVDTENPLYCPAESASKYLKSIATNESKIRKAKLQDDKDSKGFKGRKDKGITVSSFVKMLTQIAVVMQKEKGKEKLALSLSHISANDCHDYGTPPIPSPARRPIRKTRKDRAAQAFLKLSGPNLVPHEELSPEFDSISISLPKVPVDDVLSLSPTSTISLPNSTRTDVSTENLTTKTLSPLVPPGLGQVDTLPQANLTKPRPLNAPQAKQVSATIGKRMVQKRSLEVAFPELLRQPAKFARSFTCDPQSKPGKFY